MKIFGVCNDEVRKKLAPGSDEHARTGQDTIPRECDVRAACQGGADIANRHSLSLMDRHRCRGNGPARHRMLQRTNFVCPYLFHCHNDCVCCWFENGIMQSNMFREMRRKRQLLPIEKSVGILERMTNGTLALHGDDGYPYAVPVSYVYADGKIY